MGNPIKLSRYTVLFELCYLQASDPDSYREEEHPRSKKNRFARWLYFVLPGSGSPAPGVRGFARLHFLNLTALPDGWLNFRVCSPILKFVALIIHLCKRVWQI